MSGDIRLKVEGHLNGKIPGVIVGSRFITHRRQNHFLVAVRGFAFSVSVLDELEKRGVQDICLIYHGQKITYLKTTITSIRKRGKKWMYGKDEQKALPQKDFDEVIRESNLSCFECGFKCSGG